MFGFDMKKQALSMLPKLTDAELLECMAHITKEMKKRRLMQMYELLTLIEVVVGILLAVTVVAYILATAIRRD